MCGISIIINTKGEPVKQQLIKPFNDKVSHRGPDDEGYYFGKDFAFGHRRLSILDLSAAGHQPMQYEGLYITYNGEVYNYIELREELKALGHVFASETDTEVILAAYKQWGVKSFVRLNGMWAFAIHDIQKQEIILCRDHFGIKPLYFASIGDFFAAGSEIKQFTVLPSFKARLNRKVAVNFLMYGWLNYSDQTFFEDIQELRPGHYLRYRLSDRRYSVHEWYNLDKASVPVHDDFEIAVKKVRELFIDSVRIRMRSDVQVGSCLSGGIDSSAIVSIVHSNKLANDHFATITSCYEDVRYDEQKFSDEVVKQTGFRSLKIFPDLNGLFDEGHLDKMIYHQDQPFSTASHYSEFNVFRKAKEANLIVMQDGQGSDEYLCGYGEFFITRMRELFHSGKLSSAADLLKQKAKHKGNSTGKELILFIKSAYWYPFVTGTKKLINKTNATWLNKEWKKLAKESEIRFEQSNIRSLSIEEIVHSSIPYQLHSEDRNSMLFSIESRLPFLDHHLVEYVIGLPSSYKIRNGYMKSVLREAIPELPEMIKLRKDKMGFVAPDAPWVLQNKDRVRKELEAAVEGTGIFSKDLLTRFDLFTKGELNYEPIYFRTMAFYRFCKIFDIHFN